MSVEYRTINALALAAVQSGAGVEASPVPASNAVRVIDKIGYSPKFEQTEPQYLESSVSKAAPITGGGNGTVTLSALLTPSSTAGAAGDPDYGVLLNGCAMSESKLAANKNGTATAATSNSITLQNVGSLTPGMVINTTSGTGAGQTRVITAINTSTKVATVYPNWATTPDATTVYSVFKCTVYTPVTLGQALLTIWGYQHSSVPGNPSRRRRLMDAMGAFKITVKPRVPATIDFTFTGIISGAPDDVTKPTGQVFLGTDGQPVLNAVSYLGGLQTKITEFTLDSGNSVQQFDDVTSQFGYDSAEVTGRDVTCTIVPNLAANSTRNSMADWLAMNGQTYWLSWGVPGKGFSILIPSLRWTDDQPDDAQGFQVEKLTGDCSAPDNEVYLCIF